MLFYHFNLRTPFKHGKFSETFYTKGHQSRHMAQIKGLDLVYHNQVAKSAAKCRYIKKI